MAEISDEQYSDKQNYFQNLKLGFFPSDNISIPDYLKIIDYKRLVLPNYQNTSTAVTLRGVISGEKEFTDIPLAFTDVVIADVIAGLGALFVSDTGLGKTQLLKDICRYLFGGDGPGGNANMVVGRKDFQIEDLLTITEADLTTGVYNSRESRRIDPARARRVFYGVNEINRASHAVQNDFIDLAEGERNFNGIDFALGQNGYTVFMATANLNNTNGDFEGIYSFDRALMNRANMTFDLDHINFTPTPMDELDIEERKFSTKLDLAPIEDKTYELLLMNQHIRGLTATSDPNHAAFRFLVGRAMNYCPTDKYGDKKALFPTKCTTKCTNREKLCAMLKPASTRTLTAVKSMAYALHYVAELKLGRRFHVDIFDAALQAFKFTTYHGNLNEILVEEKYDFRKQMMMDDVITKLTSATNLARKYISVVLDGNDSVVTITFAHPKDERNGEVVTTAKSDSLIESLEALKASGKLPGGYTENNIERELTGMGVGVDWMPAFAERFKNWKPKVLPSDETMDKSAPETSSEIPYDEPADNSNPETLASEISDVIEG